MRRTGLLVLVTGFALVLAACGEAEDGEQGEVSVNSSVVADPIPDPTAPSDDAASSSGMTVDGGLTIPEAINYQGEEVIAVKGYVVRDGETNKLCEVLAESYPPQCGGATLTVENPETLDSLVLIEAEGIQWSEDYVTVFGHISDGVITIDPMVMG